MGGGNSAAYASPCGKFCFKTDLRVYIGYRVHICHCGMDNSDSRYGVLYLDRFSYCHLFKQKEESYCLHAELHGLQPCFGGIIYVESLPYVGRGV